MTLGILIPFRNNKSTLQCDALKKVQLLFTLGADERQSYQHKKDLDWGLRESAADSRMGNESMRGRKM